MAKTTFSGPVKSLAGFISAGNAAVVSLTADTTLTVAAHAGKILLTNDADGKFTLPSIVATAPDSDDDPNQTNNLGATFTLAGSIVRVTAIASAKYAIEGLILGSGTLVTPFADA